MKKYIFAISILCAALASCVKDEQAGLPGDGTVTFRASYTESKTVLDGLTPMWTPEDRICIYDGENNEFSNTLTAPSATAEFKGVLAGKGRQHYLAVAPYSPDVTFYLLGKTVYGLTVPQEQTAVEDSYDPSALSAIAYTTTNELSFKNLGSLVKFKIISDGVTSVTFVAGNSENIGGNFFAAYDNPMRINVKEGVDRVTLKGDFKNGSTYYLVTLPATLKNGFKVLLNGNIESMKVTFPVDLARSGLVNIGSLSLDPNKSELPESGEETPGGNEGENPGGEAGTPSGWSVLGSFNSWIASDYQLYDNGTYYVAKNVKLMNNLDGQGTGFKFTHADLGWKGVASVTPLAAGTWHKFNGEANIHLSDNIAYDVYMSKDGAAFCAVAAGATVPEYTAGGGNTGGNTGGEVEGGRTIYLNAGGSTLWDQAGAWFEVWSWKTGAEGTWYSMKSTSTAGIYECSVPQENSNIIFVRRGPGMTQGWDAEVHYWNKTDDLSIPAGSNCYTITGWGGKDGTWSTR